MQYEKFRESVLLVTGGTGSFGHSLVLRALEMGFREIRIFSRDEKKQFDMHRRLGNASNIKFIIGDVRDRKSISRALRGVDYVFSAAALKQVPSCEDYPMEAVATNIIGSANVMEESVERGVKRVVMLSTDKAVFPGSAMGMTKALMEKTAMAMARDLGRNPSTAICCTRYGNVLGSRGSVLPVWIDQIVKREPLTITDPAMTRFVMTIDQAVDLALFALSEGESGDLFIHKAPSVEMGVMAKALIGLIDDASVRNLGVRVIGRRPGEKLHEMLATAYEISKSEDMGQYIRISCDAKKEASEIDSLPFSSDTARLLSQDECACLLHRLPIVAQMLATQKQTDFLNFKQNKAQHDNSDGMYNTIHSLSGLYRV